MCKRSSFVSNIKCILFHLKLDSNATHDTRKLTRCEEETSAHSSTGNGFSGVRLFSGRSPSKPEQSQTGKLFSVGAPVWPLQAPHVCKTALLIPPESNWITAR